MHSVVLRPGHEPAAVGRPDEGGNQAAVGVVALDVEIVRVPKRNAAKAGHGDGAALRMPSECRERFRSGRKRVAEGTVGPHKDQIPARGRCEHPGVWKLGFATRDHGPPLQMLHPSTPPDIRFRRLLASAGVPQTHFSILPASGQQGGRTHRGRGGVRRR